MLFYFIISILFLIQFSSSNNQCPSSKYCTCSSDLTIIKCTDRQLTNELLWRLNSQLPNSTLLLNLSSNSLTSINFLSNLNSLQILDLSFNKIRYLPSNIFSKFPQLTSLYLRNNSLKTFSKNFQNLSNINLSLLENSFPPINSLQSKIVHEHEQFILNCSSNTKHYWTLNKNFYPSTIITSFYSIIIIHHLQINHSGIWTCQDFNFNRSISLTVLPSSSNSFCQSIQMNTSKGYFYWPRTLINKKIEKKCPFGSAAWVRNSNDYARAWYTCSSNGQWKNFDISQCGFQTNISRVFDRLSLNETNLLLRLVKYLSKLDRNQMILDDIILLIDLIDEQQEKYINQDRIMLIYHLTDFILQNKHDFISFNQYQIAITRLRLIIERLLDFTNQSWLYIGKELTAMTIQSPLVSTLCFVPNRSLLTIICDTDNHQYNSRLTTIQFPSHSNQTNQYSLFRIIVYRQSILFISDKTTNNNPAVYIRPVSRNNLSTIKFTFYDQSNEISIGIWYTNQTSWQMKSSICKIIKQDSDLISTNCILLQNNSLSITYFNKKNFQTNNFFNEKYSQLIIYIASIIASICFFISIVFYICFYKIYQIPKRLFHCLINYWFNLAVLCPLFAFGIQLNQYPFLCQFIAISLHYLCLTTILWLTLFTYSIWRKLYILSTDKDRHRKSPTIIVDYKNDGLSIVKYKSKPIIQFYLLAYGIAFIICGINVVISHEQYTTNKICFLNHFDSILILIISMLIFIFLLLIFLLITRNYIKNLTNKTMNFHHLSNEISPILISSKQILPNLNNHHLYSLDINYQYKSINQLLSILSQLILLIFLFLSSLTIYLHPLNSLKLRFEHIIYSHFYGFFVLFLAFYILSFHVLSRYHLIRRYYFNRKKDHQLYIEPSSSSINSMINKEHDTPSLTEQLSTLSPSHSHDSSNRYGCEILQNTITNDDHVSTSKRLTNITSKYYLCQNHILETNSAENIPDNTLPLSSLDGISQETMETHQSQRSSFYDRSSKRSINIPVEYHPIQTEDTQLHLSSISSSRSFTHPRISLSQAIIRPLPITRLSTSNKTKNLSNSTDIIRSSEHINPLVEQNKISTNDQSSYFMLLSSSTEGHHVINQTDHLLQQELSNEKFSIEKKSPYDYTQVLFIDEDDERSVSLKSSISDLKTSSSTITPRKHHAQILSSSSSSSFSNDFHTNQINLHESSV